MTVMYIRGLGTTFTAWRDVEFSVQTKLLLLDELLEVYGILS